MRRLWDVDVLRYYILIQCIYQCGHWSGFYWLSRVKHLCTFHYKISHHIHVDLRIICIDYTLHMSHLNILFNWVFFLFTHQKFISHWEITELRQEVKCCSECIRLVDDKLLFAIYGSPLRYWYIYTLISPHRTLSEGELAFIFMA